MARRRPSSATTPCSNCYQSASCIFRARESRTTSPTRRSDSESQSGSSAPHRRRDCLHTTKVELHRQLRLVSLLYPNPRRGGGGRRDRYTFATWSHHHARAWTPPQHRWHRTVLLADLYAGSIRFAVFRVMWPANWTKPLRG